MEMHRDNENTARVIALATAFFGGFALLGYSAGVFERLGPELTLALGLFAAGFAVLTYYLDPTVRGFVSRLAGPRAPLRKAGHTAPG